MKKLAVRGLIILAIVIACSMFFSKTIVTISTAKVKIAPVGYKRFEEKLTMQAELYFSETDPITLESAQSAPVTVEMMHRSVGDAVVKDDTIATTSLSQGFQDEVEAARQELVAAREAYILHEAENIKLVPNIDSDKNEAYRALTETSEKLATAQAELLAEAAKQGIALDDDVSKWASVIQKTEDADLIKLMENVLDASLKADDASEAFLDTYATSKTKTALYEFINKRAELQSAVDAAQNKLTRLVANGEALTTIRAEHDGYITEMSLEKGKQYDGSEPAYVLTAVDSAPVLRVDVSGSSRDFTEGMRVDIPNDYNELRAEVNSVVREGVDRKYLYIELSDENIRTLGGIRTLLNASTQVKITYRGQGNTTILPASVVRSSGENKDYIYVVETDYSSFLGQEMRAKEMSVTVIDRGDKEVSVQEDLRNTRPIYQEDRQISDGDRVMEYLD